MILLIALGILFILFIVGGFAQGYSQVGTYQEARRIRKQSEER